jgi:Transposase, Mutator family
MVDRTSCATTDAASTTFSLRWLMGSRASRKAITSVFPQTVVQTCIVHLIRNSLAFVSWKDRKAILPAIAMTCEKPSESERPNRRPIRWIGASNYAILHSKWVLCPIKNGHITSSRCKLA